MADDEKGDDAGGGGTPVFHRTSQRAFARSQGAAMPILWNIDEIHRIGQLLQRAPESPRGQVTRPEAIRMLAPDIAAMRSKGYSLAQVAAMLAEHGLAVTEAVLKVYLRRAQHATFKPKRARGAARPKHREADSGNRLLGSATRSGNTAANTPAKDLANELARHGTEVVAREEPCGVHPEEGGRRGNVVQPGTPLAPDASPTVTNTARRRDGRSDAGDAGPSRSNASGTFVPREDTDDL
jgi:hypothetical protein